MVLSCGNGRMERSQGWVADTRLFPVRLSEVRKHVDLVDLSLCNRTIVLFDANLIQEPARKGGLGQLGCTAALCQLRIFEYAQAQIDSVAFRYLLTKSLSGAHSLLSPVYPTAMITHSRG